MMLFKFRRSLYEMSMFVIFYKIKFGESVYGKKRKSFKGKHNR